MIIAELHSHGTDNVDAVRAMLQFVEPSLNLEEHVAD
jgi:hypothetical protein